MAIVQKQEKVVVRITREIISMKGMETRVTMLQLQCVDKEKETIPQAVVVAGVKSE